MNTSCTIIYKLDLIWTWIIIITSSPCTSKSRFDIIYMYTSSYSRWPTPITITLLILINLHKWACTAIVNFFPCIQDTRYKIQDYFIGPCMSILHRNSASNGFSTVNIQLIEYTCTIQIQKFNNRKQRTLIWIII